MEKIINFKRNPNQKKFNDFEDGKSLKDIADAVMKISGNVRGEVILNNLSYIESEKGKEGVRKIEEKITDLGYPIDFEKIDSHEWYQESLNVLINLVGKDVFGWEDEDIFNSGKGSLRYSFFARLMAQYLISPKVLLDNANKYWQKQFDFGKITVVEVSEKEKKAIFRVEGYSKSNLSCIYQAGYYSEIFSYVVGDDKKIEIEETKCVHAGDLYHEYKIIWE